MSDEYDKENVSDFALWKAYRPEDGDNSWDSPWGKGRPGWHLECSAMCMKYLGESIDLHSGGVDLTFPHHENEIAQSEGASGKPFAKHWFNIAHLKVDGGKMSKSIGNLYTLDDIKDWGYEAADLRYLLISGHYRQSFNFTKDGLGACSSARKKLGQFSALLPDAKSSSTANDFGLFSPVIEALCEDLNTSKALGILHSYIKEIGDNIKADKYSADELNKISNSFSSVLNVFGIEAAASQKESSQAPEEIIKLADAYFQARLDKNWSEADRLRDELLENV